MKKKQKTLQPALIGAFVLFSILLFIAGITMFAKTRFFNKETLVIAYFDDSLKGLSVGAPVTYMGVTIGSVKEIKIQIKEGSTKEHNIAIPVIISLNTDPDMVISGPNFNSSQGVDDFIRSMIKQGLRAKLKSISLVTGTKYIDFAIHRNSIAIYQNRTGKYLEIPTLPSDISQVQKMFEDIDIGKLFSKVMETLNSINRLSDDLSALLVNNQTTQIIDDLSSSAASLKTSLQSVDRRVPPILDKIDNGLESINTLSLNATGLIKSLDKDVPHLAAAINSSLDKFDATLIEMDIFLKQAERTLHPSSPLYLRLNETLKQLEKTTLSIEQLSNFISRNPHALIFGLQQSGESND